MKDSVGSDRNKYSKTASLDLLDTDQEASLTERLIKDYSEGRTSEILAWEKALESERTSLVKRAVLLSYPFASPSEIEEYLSGVRTVDLGDFFVDVVAVDQRLKAIRTAILSAHSELPRINPLSFDYDEMTRGEKSCARYAVSHWLAEQREQAFRSFVDFEAWWDERGGVWEMRHRGEAVPGGESISRSIRRLERDATKTRDSSCRVRYVFVLTHLNADESSLEELSRILFGSNLDSLN